MLLNTAKATDRMISMRRTLSTTTIPPRPRLTHQLTHKNGRVHHERRRRSETKEGAERSIAIAFERAWKMGEMEKICEKKIGRATLASPRPPSARPSPPERAIELSDLCTDLSPLAFFSPLRDPESKWSLMCHGPSYLLPCPGKSRSELNDCHS